MLNDERLQWLFDVEQIKLLKHRYCAFCDDGYDAIGIANLFLEDGIWDGGAFGRAEGRAEIRAFFQEASKKTSFANHYVTNPIVDVEADNASGKWDLWQPMVREPGPRALWLIGKYEERYQRVEGVWYIASLFLRLEALSPYEKGFAEQRFI